MAHFAQLDQNNIVTQVIVVHNNELLDNGTESESKGIDFCKSLYGTDTVWKQTSYNGTFRKNFAGIGFLYNEMRDAFIQPRPYSTWVLNTVSATGNIDGANINGNGSGLSSITAANVSGTVANATYATSAGSATTATTAGTVTANAQANITSVGILTSLSSTGNITGANINGNGSGLTSLPGANVSGAVANATYAQRKHRRPS
jgi:hypothetical protein